MGLTGQNTQRTKQFNRSLVLKTMLRNGPISRHQIAELTNLTRGTITYITSELLEEGLIQEQGSLPVEKQGAGRKSVALTLRDEAAWVIGMHIGMKEISIGLVSLNGKVKDVVRTTPSKEYTVGAYLHFIVEELKTFISRHSGNVITGLGIGVNGPVDIKKGTVLGNDEEGWPEIPLYDYLQNHFTFPVYVDRDVSSMTLAEKLFGESKHFDQFMFLYVGRTLGSGLVLNDTHFRSGKSGGGEFAHMTYQPGGRPCWCGNKGCINEYASLQALAEERKSESIEELTHSILKGNAESITALQAAGEKISVPLSSFINIIHVQRVVIGGPLERYNKVLADMISRQVNNQAYVASLQKIDFQASSLGEHIEVIGAGSLALLNGIYQYKS
ncbi:ROK family transcriptional regulator [Rossellomorea aquimaris]|uniref:ROK family transcriptional regulator n=1 Tax=Rossellomorea aquimaris TaxID=189382 RepID=UPI0005C9BAD3|nr:ROK family transcriptional regulator [Rossellomorea aquimaris]